MKIKINNKFRPKNDKLANVDFIKNKDPIFNSKYNIKMNVELVNEEDLNKIISVSEKYKRDIKPKKVIKVKDKFKREIVPKKIIKVKNKFKRGEV